ncbi:hypothetical protein [Vulcanisaeta sp. EB80]|uniref:hypothetical protein n=1 Tax=Vulcanisaeta sp. EB80 TaxID=1650660 RepID=UPI000C7D3F3C|nr:hypothetical protein [Vulcanisaeta sp. EB80]
MNTRQNWSQVRQNQQRQAQTKPQVMSQQQPQQPKKANDYGGFDPLVDKQMCKIKLGNGEVIEGLISAVSKFWYLVNVNGQVVIVNKAWVVSITPIQNPNTNNPTNEVSTNAGKASRTK